MNLFDLPERFHQKVIPVTESGCWLWTAGCSRGYGVYWPKTKIWVYAHRFAYETLRGPIPTSLQIDHLCRVSCCVNPDHLEAVTQRENILRGLAPSAMCARKTHCKNGHSLSGANLMLISGHRQCVSCIREYERLRHLRRYTPKFHRIKGSPKTGRTGLTVTRFREI